jgi:hypothetical protein
LGDAKIHTHASRHVGLLCLQLLEGLLCLFRLFVLLKAKENLQGTFWKPNYVQTFLFNGNDDHD